MTDPEQPDRGEPDRPRWDEASLLDLEAAEHDFQEFKSSRWICENGVVLTDFVPVLSKQIGAFANGAGGRLFIGIDDTGQIDGGVPVDLKGGGTRAWLEDVIPGAIDPPLRRFNVYEVGRHPDARSSRIDPGHAVYIIDIPQSEDAPHQSVDRRYYLRIAGKSRPMGHLHISDVLRRTQHPRVGVARIGPFAEPEMDDTDPRGRKFLVGFQLFIRNEGRRLARHVGADLILPRPVMSRQVRTRTRDEAEDPESLRLTQRPGQLDYFVYYPFPLFPGQEVFFLRFWISVNRTNAPFVASGQARVEWRLYADDADPREGAIPFLDFPVVRQVLEQLERM